MCVPVRVYAHARLTCKPSEKSHGQGQLLRTGSLVELRSAVSLPMLLFGRLSAMSKAAQWFRMYPRGYTPQYSLGLQA